MTLYPEFVCEMTGNSKKLFSISENETELSSPVRKKQHDTQLSVFNRLQNDAVRKLHELEEFIGMRVDIRFDEFKERVKGVEFSRLLREGSTPSTQVGHTIINWNISTFQTKQKLHSSHHVSWR